MASLICFLLLLILLGACADTKVLSVPRGDWQPINDTPTQSAAATH